MCLNYLMLYSHLRFTMQSQIRFNLWTFFERSPWYGKKKKTKTHSHSSTHLPTYLFQSVYQCQIIVAQRCRNSRFFEGTESHMANEGKLYREACTAGSIITGAWPIWPPSTLSQTALKTQMEQTRITDYKGPNGKNSNAQACLWKYESNNTRF